MRVRFAVILAIVVLPFAAGSALAADTAADAYGGGANVQNQVAGTAVAGAAQGALPFTGLDLTLIALGGASVLGLGVLIRRRASQRAD